jgi:hypothetical protein
MKRKYVVRIGIDAEAENEAGFKYIESQLENFYVGGTRGCGKEGLYSYIHDGTKHLVEMGDDL